MFFSRILAILAIDAIIIAAVFIVRITIRIVRYIRWHKFAVPAVGIVGELINVTTNYDKKRRISSLCYNYDFKIELDGQSFDNIYSENCKPNRTPSTHSGNKINILWSASKQKYLQVARTRKEIAHMLKQECISSVNIACLFIGKPSRR